MPPSKKQLAEHIQGNVIYEGCALNLKGRCRIVKDVIIKYYIIIRNKNKYVFCISMNELLNILYCTYN